MFEKVINWTKGVLSKLGLIKQLETVGSVKNHKPINITDSYYSRVALNKAIYQGFVPEWHAVAYTTSQGTKKNRNMLTMGMGKTMASKMATLIYNENCTIDIDDDGAREFINAVFADNKFNFNFQRYLEYAYALGGMAIKPYVEDGKIKLGYATAESFYPLGSSSEEVTDALFVTQETQGKTYYTLLEWHEQKTEGIAITNELYRSDIKEQLGTRIPLATLYPDLNEETIIENAHPLFTYFRSSEANNKDLNSPLGISIFENVHDQLYLLDYMYDFWFNEFELGRRRIAVEKNMIKMFTDPTTGEQHMAFDPKETVYVGLSGEGDGVKDLSVELRADDIINSINALLNIIAMKAGFSAGTFTFNGQGVKTATEVISENSATYQTKNSYETMVDESLKQLINSILDLSTLYGIYKRPDKELVITINFDDSIAQDRDSNFNRYSMAVGQGLMPKVEAMMRIWDITEDTALEWVQMINEQNRTQVSAEMSAMIGVE